MSERPCIRCQHPVLLEDGHLVYCSHCGAPQIFLSEQLQVEMAEQAREYNERNSPQPVPEGGNEPAARRWPTTQQPWPAAVQYALFSAAVALALGLLTLLFAPLGSLVLLWVACAPILTVTLYNARSASTPASSGFAARLGLLTGLLVAFSCATVFTLNLVLARFVVHDAAAWDQQLAAGFDQQRAMAIQRFGNSVQPVLQIFAIPEFRVGLLLSVVASSALFYLFLSTLAAGLAGAVLRRRRPA